MAVRRLLPCRRRESESKKGLQSWGKGPKKWRTHSGNYKSRQLAMAQKKAATRAANAK